MLLDRAQQIADNLRGGYSDEYLLNPARERRVIRVRRHWAALLKVLLLTMGIIICAFLLSRLVSSVTDDAWLVQSWLWYFEIGALLCLAWEMLEWWTTVVIITDRQFMIVSGIIARKKFTMPITKVTDMTFMSSLAGQLLGYGTFRVESAGQNRNLETIKYLPRPDEFFFAITELIFGDKKQPRSHMLEPPRSSRRRRWR